MKRLLTIALIYGAAQVGAGYLFRRRRRDYAGKRRHFLVTQGGSEVRATGEEIRDAVASVLMGGLLLDLREAQPVRRPARLDLLCIMGGIELVVPTDWKVQIDVEPLMGGIQDRRERPVDPERAVDLVLSGRVIMGGVDIAGTPPVRAMRGAQRRRAVQPA